VSEIAVFTRRSLHRKIPFPAPASETGSMTAWGVGSLVHTSPTIQSYETAETVFHRKQAVSTGFLPVLFGAFGL
jgi:hypothetical protein